MRHEMQAAQVRRARMHLLEHGHCPSGSLDQRLVDSWQRSQAAGLLPSGRLDTPDNLSQPALRLMHERHQQLLAHSQPVMEYLFEQVRHTQSIVVLAGPCGTLMHTLGDAYFLNKAERVALTSGASWHESQRGTNAIGTALAEKCALEVHGAEHYLERNGFLTCTAAPILSGTGDLLGVLDVSGDHRSAHPHTLGLVNTAARLIQNRLLVAGSRQNLRLHLHARPEGIGSLAEGIVILNEEDTIVGANPIGLAMLGLGVQDMGRLNWKRVSDQPLTQLMTARAHLAEQALPLTLRDGRQLFALLHVDTLTARSPRPPVQVPSPTDALARLDTGDERWQQAAHRTRRVLGKAIALLIQGESGVGKEWFARAAHESGPRRKAPFVAINCAALPENLIEAELFGYAPGAFTGAKREGNPGLLRQAHGGTLFLDEIGDMPVSMQARLLRVLQERQVTPLGSGQAVKVDFDLICASHRDLRSAAAEGSFRHDLYYRISGLTIELPPLRERSDLAALTAQLLRTLEPQRDVRPTHSLLQAFARYPWPGNLRQYASVLRTACAMLDDGEYLLDWGHLEPLFAQELQRTTRRLEPQDMERPPQNLQELSRSAMQRALENHRGNVSQAARTLGISRQTLYRKLKETSSGSPMA